MEWRPANQWGVPRFAVERWHPRHYKGEGEGKQALLRKGSRLTGNRLVRPRCGNEWQSRIPDSRCLRRQSGAPWSTQPASCYGRSRSAVHDGGGHARAGRRRHQLDIGGSAGATERTLASGPSEQTSCVASRQQATPVTEKKTKKTRPKQLPPMPKRNATRWRGNPRHAPHRPQPLPLHAPASPSHAIRAHATTVPCGQALQVGVHQLPDLDAHHRWAPPPHVSTKLPSRPPHLKGGHHLHPHPPGHPRHLIDIDEANVEGGAAALGEELAHLYQARLAFAAPRGVGHHQQHPAVGRRGRQRRVKVRLVPDVTGGGGCPRGALCRRWQGGVGGGRGRRRHRRRR